MFLFQTPSPPHTSKKGQKKCDSCHFFMPDLDPHPECLKFLPRSCCIVDSPCPHCAPLSQDMLKKWERQQTVKRSSSTNEGTQGGGVGVSKGGTRLVRYTQQFHCTPKTDSPGRLRIAALEAGLSSFKTEIVSMFSNLTGRFTAFHPLTLQYHWKAG